MEKETTELKVPRLETIKKTAEILNLPEFFVRTKVKNGEVVAIRAGRKTLVNVDKFVEYLNSATINSSIKELPVTDEPENKSTSVANKLGISPIPRR